MDSHNGLCLESVAESITTVVDNWEHLQGQPAPEAEACNHQQEANSLSGHQRIKRTWNNQADLVISLILELFLSEEFDLTVVSTNPLETLGLHLSCSTG